MLFYVAYLPFEFVVGIWLLAKGPPVQPTATGGALSALTGHSGRILAQPIDGLLPIGSPIVCPPQAFGL